MDLRSVKLFAGMGNRDLEKIAQQMREVRHARGAEVAIRGDDGVGFMVILDGEAEVAYRMLQILSHRLREAEAH